MFDRGRRNDYNLPCLSMIAIIGICIIFLFGSVIGYTVAVNSNPNHSHTNFKQSVRWLDDVDDNDSNLVSIHHKKFPKHWGTPPDQVPQKTINLWIERNQATDDENMSKIQGY